MLMMDWPRQLHNVLREAAVRQVAHVPDAGHAELIRLCDDDPAMKVIGLTGEQEGVALLAGAHLGGERGVLLMQSSGVGNCINMLSLTQTCRFPLLMLVTMRGEWGEFNPWQVPMGQAVTKTLEAMQVIVKRADSAAVLAETVIAAANLAFHSHRPVATLISQRLLGAKDFKG